MDVNTFFLLYGGIKAYTMFLTDCFMGNSKVNDFILQEDFFYMAKFSLAMCSLFVVKEELIEGSKNNFICKTIDEGILNCVKKIATQTKDGFEIDGVIFKNPEEIVGLIRNKLAHGEFIIDLENKKISFKLENSMMFLEMDSVINMICESMDIYYLNSSNTEYKNDIVIMNKPDKNRTKSLKTKSEIKGFLRTFSKMSFSFKKQDGGSLKDEIAKTVDMVISAYEANFSLDLLVQSKNKFAKQGYILDWEKTSLKEDLIEEVTNYVYNNYPKDMPFEHQIRFMKKDLESRLNPQKHLVRSLQKNMVLLNIAYKNQTVNYGSVLEEYDKVCSYDTIGIEELATTSFALFEAIFSYGNDKFLENSNEYTFIPSDGLDYSTLDLSSINVLYINKDNGIKNSILIELASKKKKITEMDAKISKNEQSLLQVTKNGNLKAKSILQSNLKKSYQERDKLYEELKTLLIRLNEIKLYENFNENHLRNKAIINGIRNSISHGNYKIKTVENRIDKIVFEDIYEGVLTFKCEVSITDFINMIYRNEEAIKEFLKKDETLRRILI